MRDPRRRPPHPRVHRWTPLRRLRPGAERPLSGRRAFAGLKLRCFKKHRGNPKARRRAARTTRRPSARTLAAFGHIALSPIHPRCSTSRPSLTCSGTTAIPANSRFKILGTHAQLLAPEFKFPIAPRTFPTSRARITPKRLADPRHHPPPTPLTPAASSTTASPSSTPPSPPPSRTNS